MSSLTLFEEKQVRRAWNQVEEKWYFLIDDVVEVLTGSVAPGAYWRKLNERLKKDGNETLDRSFQFGDSPAPTRFTL